MHRFNLKPWHWPYLALLSLSVLVFLISASRVSSKVDYKNTAHIFMLTSLQQWDKDGLLTYNGAPVQTYSNQGDKDNAYYNRLLDSRGNNYYISHPPGAFIINYFIIKLLGIPLTQASLQIISILFLIIGSWIVFALTTELAETSLTPSFISWGAAGAAAIYLLHPINLYAYTFHNFSETIGQFLFLLCALLWLRYSKKTNTHRLILFLLSLFLFIYTDWLAIPFVFSIVLIKRKGLLKRNNRPLIISLGFVMSAAAAIIAIQYVGISGFEAFKRALGIRYLERSGFFGSSYTDMGYDVSNPESYELLWQQLIHLCSGTGFLAILTIAITLVFCRNKSLSPIFIWLPPILFGFVLFSATITHYIYMAKFIPILAIATGLCLSYWGFIKNKIIKIALVSSFSLVTTLITPWTADLFYKSMPYESTMQESLDKLAYQFSKAPKDLRCHYQLQKNQEPRIIIYLSYAAQRNIKVLKNNHEADSVRLLKQTFVYP